VTDSDDLLATPDDVQLVANEIDRCLTEAGDRLHARDMPQPGQPLTARSKQAGYFLRRVELLDRLGTRRAAVYLRTELLNAIADQHGDDDSVALQEMGFTPYRRQPFPGSIVTGGGPSDSAAIRNTFTNRFLWDSLQAYHETHHHTHRPRSYGA